MKFISKLFHRCFLLERSCKGINGMIMKCTECERRFVIRWEDYKEMHNGVNLGYDLETLNGLDDLTTQGGMG